MKEKKKIEKELEKIDQELEELENDLEAKVLPRRSGRNQTENVDDNSDSDN